MLRCLIDDNNLRPQFELYNLTCTDLTFIEELIDNPLEPDFTADNWPCQGRSIDKSFLYEVWAVLIINLSLVLYNRLLLIKEME